QRVVHVMSPFTSHTARAAHAARVGPSYGERKPNPGAPHSNLPPPTSRTSVQPPPSQSHTYETQRKSKLNAEVVTKASLFPLNAKRICAKPAASARSWSKSSSTPVNQPGRPTALNSCA